MTKERKMQLLTASAAMQTLGGTFIMVAGLLNAAGTSEDEADLERVIKSAELDHVNMLIEEIKQLIKAP